MGTKISCIEDRAGRVREMLDLEPGEFKVYRSRKFIQIVSTEISVVGLCDDGSVWEYRCGPDSGEPEWFKFNDVPQPDPIPEDELTSKDLEVDRS